MTDKWTHAEAEALGKLPHDERLRIAPGRATGMHLVRD
jgi:hypothetical protein